MRRLLRVLRRTLVALAAIALAVTGVAFAVLGTSAGSDWLLREGATRAGVSMGYSDLHGSLLGALELTDLVLDADGNRIAVSRAVLQWQPRALLEPRLQVDALTLHGVSAQLTPTPEDASPPQITLPELPAVTLPLPVSVDRVEVSDVHVDGATALTRLTFALDGDGRALQIRSLEVARDDAALRADLVIDMIADWPITGTLDLRAALPDDVVVALRVDASGQVRAPALALTLAEPFAASGTLRGDLRDPVPALQLTLDWRDAVLPALTPITSPAGRVELDSKALRTDLHVTADVTAAPGGVRELELNASATHGDLAAPLPAQGSLQWSVRSAHGRFAGNGTLAGDARTLRLEHALEAPFALTTTGTIAPAGHETQVDLSGDWRDLTWPPGDANAPASPNGRYRVSGSLADLKLELDAGLVRSADVNAVSLELDGGVAPAPPHDFTTRLRWHAQTGPAGALDGSATANGNLHALHFTHRLDGPGQLDVGGRVTLAPALELDLNGEWRDLRWPLRDTPSARSAHGSFAIEGPLDALVTQIDAAADAAPVGSLTVRGGATLSPGGAREIDLDLALLDGSVSATGTVDWAGEVTARLALAARGINPERFHPRAAGAVNARVGVDLKLDAGKPLGVIALDELSGTLGGYPVRGTGAVTLTDDGFEARDVDLRSGDNRFTARGALGARLDLDYRLHAPALEQLWPGLGGAVTGEGRVRGSADSPIVKASLRATRLRAGALEVASANVDADVDLSAGRRSSVAVSARGLRGAGAAVSGAELALEGTVDRHDLTLSARASEGRLALAARGGITDSKQWRGELRALDALATPLGDWRLQRPVALRTVTTEETTGVDTGNACLASDGSRLCVKASHGADGQQIAVDLAALPVARFAAWLPAGLEVSGELGARAAARAAAAGTWTADATIKATPTRISVPGATDGGPLTLNLDDVVVEARHDAGASTVTLAGRLAETGTLNGKVDVRPSASGPASLSGRIQARLPDLTPFNALVPALTDLAGRLDADMTLQGSVARPTVRGAVSLSDGGASVSGAGITLERTALELTAGGDGAMTLNGTVHSGTGVLTLSGDGRLDGDRWQARIRASGEDFEAVKLLPVEAVVSPDVQIDASPGRIAVTGKVHVPRAQVTLQELPPDVVALSDDETIVGRETPAAAKWHQGLDVKLDLSLGEAVRVSAFGLDTGLTGGLALALAGSAPPTGRGTVSLVGGRFTAYGQDLKIRRGRLLFAGPLDNPGLDFNAVRETDDVVAGIAVSGTAARMRSRVFSEPSLPQAEALSWLLTGSGLSSASSSDGSRLASAAVALGLEGSAQVTRQIGSTLGLDQLTVASGDSLDSTALVIGKALTPRLYIRYALGLLDGQGTMQFDYKVTERISVEAESGEHHGADVIYRLER